MKAERERRRGRGQIAAAILVALALPLLAVVTDLHRPAPAWAANVVNVTIRIPAQVEPNPCTPGDLVVLSGQLRILIAMTADGQGGYHVTQSADEKLAGASLVTKVKYVASKTEEWTWYAGTPFPAINTHTIDSELVSLADTDNFLAHVTLHTTVTATGVPTVTVDRVVLECNG
jgi:hypothetical protein